jgi:hypothetical protein
MDVFEGGDNAGTPERVHKGEELCQIVADVQDLPETQRAAVLLREMDALSYVQIAEAMETAFTSVKSQLFRARVWLAEAAEARLLACEDVRLELGQAGDGVGRTGPPARRPAVTCAPASAAAPAARCKRCRFASIATRWGRPARGRRRRETGSAGRAAAVLPAGS